PSGGRRRAHHLGEPPPGPRREGPGGGEGARGGDGEPYRRAAGAHLRGERAGRVPAAGARVRGAGYAVLPCSLTPGCDRDPVGKRPDIRRNASRSCDRRRIKLQVAGVTWNRLIVR